MISSWNLDKLKKQAIENQDFDDYVLNQSGILQYVNLQVLDVGCSNGFKTKCYLINIIILSMLQG